MLGLSSRVLVVAVAVLGSMAQAGCGVEKGKSSDGGGGSGGGMGQGGAAAGGTGGATGTGGSPGTGGAVGAGGSAATGGAAGGGGVPGTGGINALGGAGGVNCDAISLDYVVAVQRARRCSNTTAPLECPTLVDSSLTCHCKTYVDNADALPAIAAQWTAAGCTSVCAASCPAPPTSARCVTAGDNAPTICADVR